MRLYFRQFTAMVAGLAVLGACAGDPTSAPIAPSAAPHANLLGSTVSGLNLQRVPGLQRMTGLAGPISVTRTIGAAGGTLSIPQAGVTVTVPAGALGKNTVITMVARSGRLVAYDFAPHGITFAKPLVFQQKLAGTSASLLDANVMTLGYYADPSALSPVGGTVSELISGNLNLLNWTFTSSIKHFSGYMIGCGRGVADSEI